MFIGLKSSALLLDKLALENRWRIRLMRNIFQEKPAPGYIYHRARVV